MAAGVKQGVSREIIWSSLSCEKHLLMGKVSLNAAEVAEVERRQQRGWIFPRNARTLPDALPGMNSCLITFLLFAG